MTELYGNGTIAAHGSAVRPYQHPIHEGLETMRKSFSQWRVVAAVVCMAALSAAGCKSGTWNMPGSSWIAGWTQPSNTSSGAARASTLPSPPSRSASPTSSLAQTGGANPYNQTGLAGQNQYNRNQNPYSQASAAYTGPGAGTGQQLHQSYNNLTGRARQQAQGAVYTAQQTYDAAGTAAKNTYGAASTAAQNTYGAATTAAQNTYGAATTAAQNTYGAVSTAAQNTYNTAATAARNTYQGGYQQAASAVGGQTPYPQTADARGSSGYGQSAYGQAPIGPAATAPSPSGRGAAQATASDQVAPYGQTTPSPYGQPAAPSYPTSQYGGAAAGASQYPPAATYGGATGASQTYPPSSAPASTAPTSGAYAPGSTNSNYGTSPYVGP